MKLSSDRIATFSMCDKIEQITQILKLKIFNPKAYFLILIVNSKMPLRTKILNINSYKDLKIACQLLIKGKLVAIPTETVYGLAADATNTNAIKKIFKAKERPENHPLIVHIASFDQLSRWTKDVPKYAEVLAKSFWPGPLTLLLNKHDSVSDVVTGGLKTIGIRIPKNPLLLKILQIINTGLAAPSANLHTKISPTTSGHVLKGLSGKIDAVLDGGPCALGLESTIVDLTKKPPKILRPGPITKEMIERVLKIEIAPYEPHNEKSPGNMNVHYSTETKATLATQGEIDLILSDPKNKDHFFAILHYSEIKKKYSNAYLLKISENKLRYGKKLYSSLHKLDKINAYKILIERPVNQNEWIDIHDRLKKATYKTSNERSE